VRAALRVPPACGEPFEMGVPMSLLRTEWAYGLPAFERQRRRLHTGRRQFGNEPLAEFRESSLTLRCTMQRVDANDHHRNNSTAPPDRDFHLDRASSKTMLNASSIQTHVDPASHPALDPPTRAGLAQQPATCRSEAGATSNGGGTEPAGSRLGGGHSAHQAGWHRRHGGLGGGRDVDRLPKQT
jgi:hypothetical protein